jgi:hypothetical protein
VLVKFSNSAQKTERDSTHLGAMLAHVRFFSRVDTHVYGEGRTLDEFLGTARPVAGVRAMSGMNALCDFLH